ncbi:NAD(P)(+)--arginine ADP-ribosyltransferase 2-like [Astyanax mexicanus]|uniref:NAD(P)(+)--arginine ADP-ribosyltransferase 2-like n=1 Tax=Astyanax mexicanus TaxID=7994 RepID=UPI0020CAFE9C|nr:NAD(P)(+)--arginine ADP-ribosyltransferase 2-like [Astyanax mexicanus]
MKMKMTRSVVSLLFLLTVSVSIEKISGKVYPLDLAFNSVDDAYEGCSKNMSNFISTKCLEYEKQHTPGFLNAWTNALNNAVRDKLNINQSAAIYLYTQDKSQNPGCSYNEFNNACRDGKKAYQSGDFKFYTLYYFLTEAVQALKPKLCVTVYRRTNYIYGTVVPKQRIRFGTFTSTSLLNSINHFGKVSCFKIKTCLGAKLGRYSALQHEQEVLIPPYEMFLITKINTKGFLVKAMKCSTVYELESNGTRSNLNCKKIK